MKILRFLQINSILEQVVFRIELLVFVERESCCFNLTRDCVHNAVVVLQMGVAQRAPPLT